MKKVLQKIKEQLAKFSFRTGVIVLFLCIPCYIFSFAQMALDIDASTKGILWVVFFGLAKTFQYGGLTILGVEGVKRLKAKFKKKPAESSAETNDAIGAKIDDVNDTECSAEKEAEHEQT